MSGFFLSPQVATQEKDISVSVPAVATAIVGTVGEFQWGPCFERTLVTQDSELESMFYKPNDTVYEHWWSAWNVLQYSNTLYVVRSVDDAVAKNAGAEIDSSNYIVLTLADGTAFTVGGDISGDGIASNDGIGVIIAKDTDDVLVSVTSGGFVASNAVDNTPVFVASETTVTTVGTGDGAPTAKSDYIGNSNDADLYSASFGIGKKWQIFAKYPGLRGNDIKVAVANYTDYDTESIVTGTLFSAEFEYGPADATEVAIAVLDGADSDTILEKWIVSLTPDAKNLDNANYYCEEIIKNSSNYILLYDDSANTDVPASQIATAISGGLDGSPAVGDITNGYDLFESSEEIDVTMIIDGGNTDSVTQQYIADNITDVRKDCIGIFTVPKADVVGVANISTAVTNMVTYVGTTLNRSSSWNSLYGNWKYQYDSFVDRYRWVPISGDIAGITAQTQFSRDPWFAPAFYTRGKLKNVVKLAINPKKSYRDVMYPVNINPVITSKGDGHVVLGQKTLLASSSSFNRLDVRWLFLVIEKAIAQAAKAFMGEKNTDFVRRQFKGVVDPYLRDVQGREGITDFFVQVDENVNTAAVIARNELRASIYVKPTMTAEFIVLEFVNVGQGVSFSEVIKKA